MRRYEAFQVQEVPFGNKTEGAGLLGGDAEARIVMLGQNHDSRPGKSGFDARGGAKPIEAGHGEIHKDKVRPCLGILVDGFLSILALDEFTVSRSQNGSNHAAKRRVIVNDHDLKGVCHTRLASVSHTLDGKDGPR